VTDLPPGFELEAGGLPEGFELEQQDISEQIVRQATGLAAVAGPAAEPSYAQVVPRALEGFGRNAYGAGGAVAQAIGEIPTPVLSSDMQRDASGGSGTFGNGTLPAAPAEQGGGVMVDAGGGTAESGVPAPTYDTGRRQPLAPGLAAAGRGVAVEQRQAVQKLREGIPEGISGKGVLFDVVTNAPQIAVPLAIGAVNPAAGVAVGSAMAGGISFGNRYDELRNVRQLPVGDAWQGAAVSGAAEVLTEKLALDAIIKTGKAAGLLPALKRIAVAAGAEGAQESLVQAIEEGYNAGVLGDETTLGEALSKIGYAGLVGAIIGGGVKGVAETAQAVGGNRAPVPGSPPPAGGPAPSTPPPAPTPPAASPPAAGPAPSAAPPSAPPAAAAGPQVAPPAAAQNPAALPDNDVDLENFGDEPLPGDVVRQQFLAERGLAEQDDGSFVTEDGTRLDPADAATLHDFLAAVDDAVVELEDQMVPVTPDTIRRELQSRQRLRDLETERENVRTPEAKAVLDEQIAAASEPAGGAAAELQAIADQASERGDTQTAKAAQAAIKTLQEPGDGAVADGGSEGGRADLGGSLGDAAGAGPIAGDAGGASAPAIGTGAAGAPPVAVGSGAGEPTAGVGTAEDYRKPIRRAGERVTFRDPKSGKTMTGEIRNDWTEGHQKDGEPVSVRVTDNVPGSAPIGRVMDIPVDAIEPTAGVENPAPVPGFPRRAQPGEPDYTLDDAQVDLRELVERQQANGRVTDDRLQEQIRRQIELIRQMKPAEAAPADNKQGVDVNETPAGEPQAPKPSTDEPQGAATSVRRGEIGGKLAAGEVVTTATGRPTTPFPKIDMGSDRKAGNTLKRVDEWLMQNALAEAEARGDEFNARSFRQDLKNPPPAAKDSAEEYLFGDRQPPVLPKALKPLVTTAKAGEGATAIVFDPAPMREDKPTVLKYLGEKGASHKVSVIPPREGAQDNASTAGQWSVQTQTKAGSVTVPTQTQYFDTEQQALEFAQQQKARHMGKAAAESNKTAPEHDAYPTEGASEADLKAIVKEFNDAQAAAQNGEQVTHVFDPPAKGEVVRLQDKVKVQVNGSGWMTVEDAKARVAEWKAHAKAQGADPKARSINGDKVVLSLFDLSGEWSQPWVDAGYQVYRFDIQDDPEHGDVTKFSAESFMDTFSAFEGQDVHAILAACPCTDFAVSGARHFAAKDADGRTVSSVKLVHQTLATIEFFKPAVWAIENPVGRIESLTGLPPWRLSFDPNHFGDPYTKKTLLWGRFDGDLPIAPVEPTEGSKMHKLYGGKSQATKNARSVTPEGFSYGFFMANNAVDNPLLAVAGKYDRLDRDAIQGALDAGLTPSQIGELVDDFYYMELDDEAANAALRDAAKPSPDAPRTDEGSKPEVAEKAAEPAPEKPATLADQLAAMSDADLEALIDDVAHETRAAETEKPVAKRSGKTRPPKAEALAKDALIAAYFTPGNIVRAYRGHDRVLKFEAPEPWAIQVTVQAVVQDANGEWINDPEFPRPRVHETRPDARELAAGPVKSSAPWPPAPPLVPAPKLRKGKTPVERATKPADVDRTAGEIAKSLSVNLSSAGQNALTGLTKLFGSSGKLSAGLTFDEDTYAKAKPHFQALLRDFQAAGKDLRDLIRELVNMLGTGARPYILRFAQDLRTGKDTNEAGDEQADLRVEDPAQPDAVAPGADPGAARERAAGGDGAGAGEAGAGAAAGADGAGVSRARGRGSREQRDREPAAGGGRGSRAVGARGTGEAGSGVPGDPVAPAPGNIPAANFEIGDDLRLGRGGEVEKFNDNIAAIEALRRIEAENRRATAEEQKLLARYVGWGGLANAFPDPSSGEWSEKWKDRGPRLRDLLSKAEYTAARRSTRNAHYTSEPIVRGMWRAARRLGFRGGLALESSMGVGNFLGLKPADLPAKFVGIEYDSLTSRIAGALYPQATVLHAGFQSVPLPDSTFALSIGNPPFGSESLRFQFKPELNGLSIHNQFFLGALDAVRPGGLHIAVVSRFLLDAQDTASRLMLAERGELVAAIRLPDTAFKENARTEVVTDIIILRRRDAGEQESMKLAIQAFRQPKEKDHKAEQERAELAAKVPEWVQTVEIADPLGGEAMRVNRYFKSNPQNIIGILERSGSMKQGADITVRLDDVGSLERRLNEIVDRLPENVSRIGQDVLDTTEQRYALLSDALKIAVSGEEIGHVKLENDGTLSRVLEREGPDGSLLLTKQALSPEAPFSDQLAMDENGRWYRNEVALDDKGAPVKMLGKDGKPGKRNLYERRVFPKDSEVPLTLRLGKAGFAKLKSLAGLRDLLKKQLVLETEDAESSVMEGNRKKLAAAYKAFVDEHGPINRAATLSLAMTMPDGGLISALEVRYQPARSKVQAERSGLPEQDEEAKPAPILRERVVPKYEPPTSAGTAADALAIVLAERGHVDLERIAQLRGTTEDAAVAELQKGDKPLVFLDPETQAWETRDAYLSGQVRRKLAAARNAGLEQNIAALEAIQPAAWGSDDVRVKIGATWMPPATYAQFIEHLIGGSARVNFSAPTNSFNLDVSEWDSTKRGEWGTQRAPAEWIIGRILNSLPTSVYDTDSDGKTHLNQDETQLAQIKAREITNAFDEWIFADADRRTELVALFNEKYNTRVSRQFDGSHLTLPGKVPDAVISMRRHQKNAIWRGISTKALLLDHVVGAGKTFTGIARVMERRRMGISRKPAIVVPNHLVEQWAADVYRLYPAAKVLAAGKSDFEAKNRRKLFGKIATGDWDVVIIPHSSFGFIGIAPETELRYLEAEMAHAQAAIEEAWEVARENGQDEGRRKPFNVKEAERLAEKIQGRMDKLREGTRDRLLTYEQLGIDDLTIDEAHEFKNLFYSSRLTGVRGMGNKTGSRKAADLYNKVRVTRDVGGSVTFMTGTPVSNSAVELYTMMRYLVPEALEELGLTHFDAWRAQYVDASPAFEPTETGRLKQVTRMGRSWENMRSLMDLYYSFSDAVTIDDIKAAFAEDNPGKEFPVPKVKGGDRQLVKIEPTEAQSAALNEIIAGFDGLDSITDPFERNATRLRLMDRARKVSLDVRAVDPASRSTEAGGKLGRVADEVRRIYDASQDRRGTQLIFLDRSVPKTKGDDAALKRYDELVARQEKALADGDEAALQDVNEELEKFDGNEIRELRAAQNGGWNAYQQIKDNLVAMGIPAAEIRFIQEANTDEQKDALFDAVRSGKVRVLLGSTPRMGAGTNVQDRLVGLHHVDVTWKPSDIEQREGRIIRQGNLFASPEINGKPNPLYDPLFEVEILAYATERTVDSKMWSLNATKLKTINGLRKYDGSFTMQIDDEESVSMAEMAALASGNPLLLERVQLDSEISDLELQQRAHRRKQMALEDEIRAAERGIEVIPGRIAKKELETAEAKRRVDAALERLQDLSVNVEGKTYTRLPEAQKAAYDAIQSQQAGDERAKYAVSVEGKRYTNKADIADAMGEALGDAEPFEITVGDKVYVQRTAASRAIRELVLKAAGDMGLKRDANLTIGKAFGYELVADLARGKSGKLKVDFALVDGEQTVLYAYGPEFTLSGGEGLSLQALRPAVGGIFSQYASRASDTSVAADRSTLAYYEAKLPELKAKPVVPFPKADELAQKIERLKAVVAELSDTAEKPKDQPSFSRGTDTAPKAASPAVVARVESMVQAITKAWASPPKVVVVASMQDPKVPERVREADAAQKAGGATGEPLGWIMGGTIYVNAGTANTPASVIRTVNHEALGHFGLRGMFGSRLDDELKKVALLRAKDVKAKLVEYGMEDTSRNRLRAAEEVLARMAEETPSLPLVQRVLAAIRSFLRPIFEALGVKLDLSDAEIIRDYLIPARDYVRNGARRAPAPAGVPSGAFRRAARVAIDRGGRATALVGQDATRGARRGEVIVERSDSGWRVAAKGEGVVDKDVRRALLVAQGEPAAFSRVVVDRAGNVVPLIDRDRAVRAGEVVLEEAGDGWSLLDRGAGVTDGMVERAKLAADDRLPVFSRGSGKQRNPQIDTLEFKRWFGDWAIAGAVPPRSASTFDEAREQAQAFQGKPLTNDATGIVAQAGRNALDKMLSGKAVGKSESPAAHALAVANLDHLYQRAMLGWSKPDAEGNPNVKAIHRFFTPMMREGKPMLAKLTVKETVDPAHANPLYTVEAVEFNEKSPAAQWVDASANADGIDLTSIRSARDVKTLAQRVQDFDSTTVSRVVDENGEPLRVYHGTVVRDSAKAPGMGNISAFDRMFTTQFRAPSIDTMGSWFSDNPGEGGAQMYSGAYEGSAIYPVYLSIKNPQVTTFSLMLRRARLLANGVDDGRRIETTEVDAYRKWLKEMGKDGIKIEGSGNDGSTEFDNQVAWIALEPNQIKSATGNNGNFDPADPRIDFNRGPAAPASWQAPDPTRLDDFIHALQDKNVDLRRAMQEMRKAGAAIADAQDAYTVEELSTSRKAAQIKAFIDTDVAAVLKQMNLEGLKIEEVEEYLHARHAPEANAQIASINPTDPNMQDGGSGMLTQDALDYMAALPRSKALALGRVARLVDDINEGTKQRLVASGLEKAETIAEWDATYQHYVPLHREGFEGQAGRGTGQGVSVRGTAIKSRMGSKRAVVDILANVVMQREKVITRAENNRVGQALLGLAIKNPNPAFWLPVNPDVKTTPSRSRKLKRELISMGLSPQDADGVAREPLQRHYNPLTGLVEYRVNPALRNRDNVISVRVNGKDRFIFFKEDEPRAMRMAEALKNMDARDMGRMMRMLGSVTRYFASINTQFNIIFGQVNFLRDVQAALLNLGDTPLAGQGMVVAKEARRLYAATFKTAFRLDKLQGADLALWQRFRDAGGPTGFRDIFPTSTARTEALRRELDPEWWTKTQWGKVLTANGALKMPEETARQWVSHAFRWISDYNQALENITRMAAFKTAVESGLSDQQAASLAKNLTTNFNRRGAWSQQLGAWYAFFNAGVQGTARIAKAMTKLENGKVVLSEYGKRIVAGGIGLGVVQALALAASGADDDEPPEFIRERNLLLPDFFTGSGGYVSIPMPLGWHVLPNIGRKLTELALRGGERPVDAFTDLFRITLDAFNPLGSGTLAQTLSPTAADPIVALNANRDWTGRPIAREDRNSLDPTPGFTRGRDNSSVVGETIAEGLNWLTGGTDFTPGAASPTPDQVDYLAGQIGGGVAREIIKGIDSAGALASGEAPPLYRVPLLGRFVGTTHGQSSERNRFYENELKVNVAENEARGRASRGENIEAYLKKHPEALLKPTMDKVKRDIDKLNRARREQLAAGASAAEVRPMAERISELQRAMNQKYREVQEAR